MKIDKHARLRSGLILLSILVHSAGLYADETLGKYPLCEASAALIIPCPDKSDTQCLLVGDNEQGNALYLFTVEGDQLGPMQTIDLKLKGKDRIDDIEALSISGDKIVAFASHSRDSACEFKKKRQRFGNIDFAMHQTSIVAPAKPVPPTCNVLFAGQEKDPSVQAVCNAIDTANTAAAAIEAKLNAKSMDEAAAKAACYTVDAFNAEGAVTFTSGNEDDTWIGLRAPLLKAHPDQPEKKDLAILLHLKDLTAYTFDRVAFVDMGGRAIRDLHANGDFVWIIAGPEHDGPLSFQLRRIAKSSLAHSKIIDAQLVIDNLPVSSEGLALSGNKAYVVTDGDDGKSACVTPARYKVLSLD